MSVLMVALVVCVHTVEHCCLVLISATDQVICVLLYKGRYRTHIYYISTHGVFSSRSAQLLAFLLMGLRISSSNLSRIELINYC